MTAAVPRSMSNTEAAREYERETHREQIGGLR
jgi:hypothetical protein